MLRDTEREYASVRSDERGSVDNDLWMEDCGCAKGGVRTESSCRVALR